MIVEGETQNHRPHCHYSGTRWEHATEGGQKEWRRARWALAHGGSKDEGLN